MKNQSYKNKVSLLLTVLPEAAKEGSQHPRDLFDVKHILQNEGFNQDIKTGFIYCLLSSARPIHELLNPHFQDQKEAMENQFDVMTEEAFTYEDFEATLVQLVETIHKNLTEEDKAFLLSYNR